MHFLSILFLAMHTVLHWVHTSDVHASLTGFAAIQHHVDSLRQKYGDALIVSDGGDVLQGTPYAYYYNYVDTTRPHLMAETMNRIGYDVQALGNHDIETGHAVYDRFMRQCRAPFVGANIIDERTGQPYVQPYTILERCGARIAVVGMMTPAIPSWLPRTLWSDLRFDDMAESCRHWVQVIKETEHPDLIVGLFHSGWDGGIATPEYRENATRYVAEHVPGFDLILYGHDHHAQTVRIGRTLCTGPASQGTRVCDITIDLTSHEITASTPMPTSVPATTDKTVDEWVARPIGTLTDTLHERDAYFGPNAFIDLIHELQLELSGADISFAAPLSFDGVIPAGPLRVADMFTLYKYENFLYTMRMTGREVKGFLEMSYALWSNQMKGPDDHALLLDSILDNGRRKGLVNYSYNMDAAAGIRYDVDLTRPAGERITIYPPFDETKTYRVAMNSYRGNGGGELMTRGAGIPRDSLASRVLYATDKDLRYYLMQRIIERKTVEPHIISQWRFTPTAWTAEALRRDRKILFP